MASPKFRSKKSLSAQASGSFNGGGGGYYYLVLLVKILLVVLILLWLAPLVESRKRKKRRYNTKQQVHKSRLDCESSFECSKYIPEESMNCIHECISPTCYQQIYGNEPLEPGEVDSVRFNDFEQCILSEIREMRRQGREGIENPVTGSTSQEEEVDEDDLDDNEEQDEKMETDLEM